jgi:hypothetical protein
MSLTTLREGSLLRKCMHPNSVTFKTRLGEPSAVTFTLIFIKIRKEFLYLGHTDDQTDIQTWPSVHTWFDKLII